MVENTNSKLLAKIEKLEEKVDNLETKLDISIHKLEEIVSLFSKFNVSLGDSKSDIKVVNLETMPRPVKFEKLYNSEDHSFIFKCLERKNSKSNIDLIKKYYIDNAKSSFRIKRGHLEIWDVDSSWYSKSEKYGKYLIKNIIKLYRLVNDFDRDCKRDNNLFSSHQEFISSLDTPKNYKKILEDIEDYLLSK